MKNRPTRKERPSVSYDLTLKESLENFGSAVPVFTLESLPNNIAFNVINSIIDYSLLPKAIYKPFEDPNVHLKSSDELTKHNRKVKEIIENSKCALARKAWDAGGNAVLGAKFNILFNAGLPMVLSTGTAVYIEDILSRNIFMNRFDLY